MRSLLPGSYYKCNSHQQPAYCWKPQVHHVLGQCTLFVKASDVLCMVLVGQSAGLCRNRTHDSMPIGLSPWGPVLHCTECIVMAQYMAIIKEFC